MHPLNAAHHGIYAQHAFEGILEIRKEKSRDAARSRRGKENYEFFELAKMLPLPAAITSQLDKASIIRLTISYLKLKDFSCHGDPPWHRDLQNKLSSKGRLAQNGITSDLFEVHQGTHILQSLDGFAFALSNDGRFLYISETVSIYLGLSQVEMTGSSIFEYVHSHDQHELAEQLGLQLPHSPRVSSPLHLSDDDSLSQQRSATPPTERITFMNPSVTKGFERTFCIRMKSTLTKRGVHVKCAGYRVVQILAHMRPQMAFSLAHKQPPSILGLVGMAIALPPPTITELLIDNDMFISRLSPELNINYVEPRLSDMMDMNIDDITNKSLYEFCHAEDLQKLRQSHIDLLNKGQVLTDYYRLMNKHGGYVWLQTCATIICNSKSCEDQNIIAINYVLSGIEYQGCIMNMSQFDTTDCSAKINDNRKDEENGSTYSVVSNANDGSSKKTEVNKETNCGVTVQKMLPEPCDNDNSNYFLTKTQNNLNENYPIDEKKDAKNSRRKMEKPRKRKIDSSNDESFDSNNRDKKSKQMFSNTNPTEEYNFPDNASNDDHQTKINEKLMLNNSFESAISEAYPHRKNLEGKRHKMDKDKEYHDEDSHIPLSVLDGKSATSTSVKDLEYVMNRHLPNVSGNEGANMSDNNQDASQKQMTTIQWIGTCSPENLPATNLLRSLYATRESVIRTNVSNPRPHLFSSSVPSFPDSLSHIPLHNSDEINESKLPSSIYYPSFSMPVPAQKTNATFENYAATSSIISSAAMEYIEKTKNSSPHKTDSVISLRPDSCALNASKRITEKVNANANPFSNFGDQAESYSELPPSEYRGVEKHADGW